MGSPEDEPDRRPEEKPHRRQIPRSFAIATKEVTVRQFREFLKANPDVVHDWRLTEMYLPDVEPDDGPVLGVTWFAAAQYCRWLSELEGIPEEEMCYPPIAEIKDGMGLPPATWARPATDCRPRPSGSTPAGPGHVTSRPFGDEPAGALRPARPQWVQPSGARGKPEAE